MITNRYIARREFGSDWKVVDQLTNADVATGLTHEEAEESVNARNQAKSCEKATFSAE